MVNKLGYPVTGPAWYQPAHVANGILVPEITRYWCDITKEWVPQMDPPYQNKIIEIDGVRYRLVKE